VFRQTGRKTPREQAIEAIEQTGRRLALEGFAISADAAIKLAAGPLTPIEVS
jgi:hypothetical protein